MKPARHRYGDKRAQFGELYRPPGPGPFPVAVVVHGGFWRARYTGKLMTGLCVDLVERCGWAAWNLEYRRLGPLSRGGWPATFEDVAAGTDLLAELDAPLHLDRVVTVGHSAGGHLALWLASRGDDARVRPVGAVSQAGVTDLAEAHRLRLGAGVVGRLLGGSPAEHPERYAAASPAERLPLGVPQLLVHGERDDTVPAALSERYARAARAAGDRVDVDLRAGEGHFEHIDPKAGAWRSATDWMERQVA